MALPAETGPTWAPDQLSIWPVEGGRFGIDAHYHGESGKARAQQQAVRLERAHLAVSVREHEDGATRRAYRYGQIGTASLVSLAHGTNDAQKTMGVISLALIANGTIKGGDAFDVPTWVVVSCGLAIGLGTYTGGWRIIKTLGTKVTEVRPPQGFSSEEVAATVILASSHFGYPLSTTHVVSGAVTGSGVGRPGASVDWSVAGRIVTGWVLTIPAAGVTAAAAYGVTRVFGDGAVGPICVFIILAISCFFLWRANKASHVLPDEIVTKDNPFFERQPEAVHA